MGTFSDNLVNGGPFNHEPITHFNDMVSLDFLPLVATNHPTSFDDLLNEEIFARDDPSFGVEFAFNSPMNVGAPLQPQSIGGQAILASAAMMEPDLTRNRSGIITPGLRNKLNITASAQAFKESLWLWTPAKDDHGYNEQRNLSLPWNSTSSGQVDVPHTPPAHQRMTNSARGLVLAMVLRTCEPNIYPHVVSNFPSTQLMTHLIHDYLSFQSKSEFPYIHIPTVEIAKERAEFLAILIAYGAALSPKPELRKLGFAMQEAQRLAVPVEVYSRPRLLYRADSYSSNTITGSHVTSDLCRVWL